ncbi:MAG: hydrogenase maturation nickel metallochaperone HypA [Candidatus Omnitrophica bacterium]|nr:hydrogenase maturation nickel metallochaperone HypA [Candidatus Omnitrophota bacterium]
MHEGNFTEQIVEAILQQIEAEAKGRAPKKVKVSVGEVFHLVPDAVQMHYAMITENSLLKGAELELVEVPVVVKCLECGETNPVEDHHLLMCPQCDSQDVQTVAGNSIVVDGIEYA